MVTLRVRFYGAVRTMVRRAEARFGVAEGATLGDLAELLATSCGHELVQMLFDHQGKLRDFAKVFVNGEELNGEALQAPLVKDASSAEVGVFVLSPVVGGA